MAETDSKSKRNARKCAELSRIIVKQEISSRVRQIGKILKKSELDRTEEDNGILSQSPDIVEAALKRAEKRQIDQQRKLEVEDRPDLLRTKCKKLAEIIKSSRSVVVYTGAGISTAASIPDYRGPNGVWTLLEKGIQLKAQDLSDAQPTKTHMAIAALHREGYIQHVVSQNCDGLHLRSGLPPTSLSEVHGNMFIEMCKVCCPIRLYVRLFDVTERTGVRRHKTTRMCHFCGNELKDTIVHFGEKGLISPPYNWNEAAEAVDEADTVLCLGSSLKVLRRYACLWAPHKPIIDRPKLVVVNLQWTPKDEIAALKINGQCDKVIDLLMENLGIPQTQYDRTMDPIFGLCTPLKKGEEKTTSKKILEFPIGYKFPSFPVLRARQSRLRTYNGTGRCGKHRKNKDKHKTLDTMQTELVSALDEEYFKVTNQSQGTSNPLISQITTFDHTYCAKMNPIQVFQSDEATVSKPVIGVNPAESMKTNLDQESPVSTISAADSQLNCESNSNIISSSIVSPKTVHTGSKTSANEETKAQLTLSQESPNHIITRQASSKLLLDGQIKEGNQTEDQITSENSLQSKGLCSILWSSAMFNVKSVSPMAHSVDQSRRATSLTNGELHPDVKSEVNVAETHNQKEVNIKPEICNSLVNKTHSYNTRKRSRTPKQYSQYVLDTKALPVKKESIQMNGLEAKYSNVVSKRHKLHNNTVKLESGAKTLNNGELQSTSDIIQESQVTLSTEKKVDGSVPGWFGKGYIPRKIRRKKLSLR